MPGLNRFYSVLIALLLCFPAMSQDIEIRARVIDSSNLEPVAFSTIYIDEYSGTITDDLGFFRLQVPREKYTDTLHISCIGYQGKDILIRDLNLVSLDSIFLQPGLIELSEVEVQAKSVRAPRAKEIIRLSVSRIPDNYPDTSVLYQGYYREYVKKDDDYINLFESIINLEDPGFQTVDNFNAGLVYKRVNENFLLDSSLMRPYDNLDKFVPYSSMPIPLNNELLILRAHDPVRNYNRNSLYFINRLEKDFIRHHDFSTPKLTYLDDRPYYHLTVKDNQKYYIGTDRVTASGTIFIDALNYGIKRINYRSTIDKGSSRQKLFELNLEYTLENDVYLLNYLSFNNLFYTRNFIHKKTGISRDKLELGFSLPFDPKCAGNPENISVILDGREQEIRDIEVRQTNILISFSRQSDITDRLKMNLLPRNVTTRKKIAESEKYLMNNLHIEFSDFTDLEGNEIVEDEFNSYYQYREFFTNETSFEHNGITSNLVNKSKSIIENRIFGQYSGDTSWLNTPLIDESVLARTVYSNNPALNGFIEAQLDHNENNLNELIYIHTDREVYAPEDTLWFKTYIRNKTYLTGSRLSKNFDIILADSKGEIIKQDRYLHMGQGVHGHIFLEHTLEEGVYYILGYSSWMKNFDTGAMFSKRILVMKEKRDDLLLVAAFDKPEYFPGDTVRMLVNCYDGFNRTIDDVRFTYRFISGGKTHQRGRGSTVKSWLDPIPFVIPPDIDTLPAVEFVSEYKAVRLDTAYSLSVNRYLQMDFFPEGGNCYKGIETIMAFKAVINSGDPLEVEGEIIDEEGKVLATAASRHDGMGEFLYKPEEGSPRYFRVTNPAGLKTSFLLPEGMNTGWQMNVIAYDRENKQIELRIDNINTANDTALVTLSVRGYLLFYEAIKTGRKKSLVIPTADLPQGVAVLTLFDSDLLPRAERLIYVHPANEYKAELSTDRQRYIPRDSVQLSFSLSSGQPVLPGGSYSLSVIDEDLCATDMIDEPDITTSLLLTSEIRGKIHRSDYYFDAANPGGLADLDLLLMTQGWRNYRYPDGPEQAAGTMQTAGSARPVNQDIISGSLVKQAFGGTPRVTDGQINVLFGGNTSFIPVGKDGEFSFMPAYTQDFNTGLFMYAVDGAGKSNLSIVLDPNKFEDDLDAYIRYLADSIGREPLEPVFSRERLQDHFSLGLENHQWLEEVSIRKTVIKEQLKISDLSFTKREATRDQIDAAIDMEHLESLVQKLGCDSPYYFIDGMLQFTYISDGMSLPVMVPDYEYAYHILPDDIEEYILVRDGSLYGFGVGCVIDIKLKPISDRPPSWKWENPVSIRKFTVSKEFYKPLYDTEEKRKSTIPDLRKTIHWEPELQLDADGRALVKFYNGDRYTRIRCILEGITDEGVPIHIEHYYDVTLTRAELGE